MPEKYLGVLFEQFVGLELIRHAHFVQARIKICFWRDLSGPEVDWVIVGSKQIIPVEVKWTDAPTLKDAKHLQLFINEYPQTHNAYIVCRTPRKMKLADRIFAIPWQDVSKLLTDFALH